jgi:hypothetical protein
MLDSSSPGQDDESKATLSVPDAVSIRTDGGEICAQIVDQCNDVGGVGLTHEFVLKLVQGEPAFCAACSTTTSTIDIDRRTSVTDATNVAQRDFAIQSETARSEIRARVLAEKDRDEALDKLYVERRKARDAKRALEDAKEAARAAASEAAETIATLTGRWQEAREKLIARVEAAEAAAMQAAKDCGSASDSLAVSGPVRDAAVKKEAAVLAAGRVSALFNSLQLPCTHYLS